MRSSWMDAVDASGVLDLLSSFDPHVVGTPPLGLDLPSSDIDVCAFAEDPNDVATLLWAARDRLRDLSMKRWTVGGRPLVAAFRASGWSIEVFAAAVPVRQQAGWRHFDVESRLLGMGGGTMHEALRERRLVGMKTEPAFADLLQLAGDPYAAMFGLSFEDDDELARLVDVYAERGRSRSSADDACNALPSGVGDDAIHRPGLADHSPGSSS